MKNTTFTKLILSELILLFLATTFISDNPPGWYQQTMPVNDQINDIFFLDSLTGWVVTNGNYNANDTSYIMHTTDGGNNWVIQEKNREALNVVQFLNANTGYAAGGVNGTVWCTILKTTNSGTNWTQINNIGLPQITDVYFLNFDTGWVCGNSFTFGGLWKTTDGAQNWTMELDQTYRPYRMSFINKDTGWAVQRGTSSYLYKTINGGVNWEQQFTFTQQINDLFFFNSLEGIASSGFSYITTNGGLNWTLTNDGGIELAFANDSSGWAGTNFEKVMRTTNKGNNWFQQSSPINDNSSAYALSGFIGWAGGLGLVHTTDGGGPVGIKHISGNIPEDFNLYQNYPNPFNPKTIISYELRVTSYVLLTVYDIQGRHITDLVNQKQNAGTYQTDFSGNNLSSGIYFYSLYADGKLIDTKKMLIIK